MTIKTDMRDVGAFAYTLVPNPDLVRMAYPGHRRTEMCCCASRRADFVWAVSALAGGEVLLITIIALGLVINYYRPSRRGAAAAAGRRVTLSQVNLAARPHWHAHVLR